MQEAAWVLLVETAENLRWLTCITCAVVSIPSKSRITRASEGSFGICTSCVPFATVVSIFKALINVWNEVNTSYRLFILRQNVAEWIGGGGRELNVNLRNDSIPDDTVLWAKKKEKKKKKIYIYRDRKCMILMLKGNLNSTKNYEIIWASLLP